MPYVLALALLALPLGFGYALGRWGGRPLLRLIPGRSGPALLLPALGLASGLVAVLLPLGVWDAFALVALVVAGAARGALPLPARRRRELDRRVAFAAVLTLVLVEGAARLALPAPPRFPLPPSTAFVRFGWHTTMDAEACALLFPDDHPKETAPVVAAALSRPNTVLHLGDSMVFSWEVPPAAAAPALMAALDGPDVAHVSLALPGIGPAFHLLAIRRWLPRLPHVVAVVIHLCAKNDLFDVERFYPCCGHGPLLEFREAGPVPRCPTIVWEKQWSATARLRFAWSPPPYPIRVAARHSAAAAHLMSAFVALSALAGTRPNDPLLWDHVEATLRALRDEIALHGIPLLVSMTPHREDVDGPPGGPRPMSSSRQRFRDILTGLEVPWVDASDFALSGAVTTMRPADWFLDNGPQEIHLSVAGHRAYAAWLLPHVRAMRGPGARP